MYLIICQNFALRLMSFVPTFHHVFTTLFQWTRMSTNNTQGPPDVTMQEHRIHKGYEVTDLFLEIDKQGSEYLAMDRMLEFLR